MRFNRDNFLFKHNIARSTIVKVFLFLLLVITYFTNLFLPNNTSFGSFQGDSESLVISSIAIARDDIPINNRSFGLGWLRIDEQNSTIFSAYQSQVGLQGWVWYFLTLFIKSSTGIGRGFGTLFHLICCMLLSIVFVWICSEIRKKYNLLLAGCFFITFWLSPWIVNFARNLYWVEFTWFVPMLLDLLVLNNINKRKLLYPLFFIAIFIKCLCGYEYITTIMMGSIMFLMVEFITISKTNRQYRKLILSSIMTIGVVSVVAFFTALLLHAYIRSGNIYDGLVTIFKNDVLRRTLGGNPNDFPEVYGNALKSSIIRVVYMYTRFPTPVLSVLEASWFPVILFVPLVIFCLPLLGIKYKYEQFQAPLYVVSIITCVSWYVLGKSHSYIHTHMNYVLWYFGVVQICLYVIIRFISTYVIKSGLKKEGKI